MYKNIEEYLQQIHSQIQTSGKFHLTPEINFEDFKIIGDFNLVDRKNRSCPQANCAPREEVSCPFPWRHVSVFQTGFGRRPFKPASRLAARARFRVTSARAR